MASKDTALAVTASARTLSKQELKLITRALNADIALKVASHPVVQVLGLYVATEGLQKIGLLGDVAGNVVEGAGLTAIGMEQLAKLEGPTQAAALVAGALGLGAYGIYQSVPDGNGGNGGNGADRNFFERWFSFGNFANIFGWYSKVKTFVPMLP